MGILIKDMLDSTTFNILTSNSDPHMIRQENVAQAARELIKAIKSLTLYSDQQPLINQFESLQTHYPTIYSHRAFYVWQLGQAFYQITSLNLPDADFLRSNSLKCRFAFLNILLDDICDLGRDKRLFDQCVLALKGQINQNEHEFIELYQLISNTWLAIQNAIKQAPNYTLLKPVFEEAYQKWITSFEYSLSLEKTSRFDVKWEEHLEIISHSGTIYLAGLIDLLFVPNLVAQQVSSEVEVFLRTQKMTQIANWLVTWPRELAQHDFTGGVFSIALQNHWVDWDGLNHGALEKVKEQIRNSPVEEYLWNEWERLRVESRDIVEQIQLPALDGYVESFSALMFTLIASTGLV